MTDKQIFFACGAPKSGTTWLQRVLDAHPEVQCSGEGHFIECFTAPLSTLLRDYAARMSRVGNRVYEGQPYYPQITQFDLDRVARGFIFDRLMARNPAHEVRWVGDKTPGYAQAMPQLLRIFPEARFLNIVRDPRDVTVARLHHFGRVTSAESIPVDSFDIKQFAREGALDWMKCVEPIAAFAAEHPGQLHSLRYEDMIADPAEEARKIFRFLKVQDDAATVAKIIAATSFEAQSGRKPGEESLTSFLRKGVVGDWVGQLEQPVLAELHDTCGDLMQQYGYV